MPVRRVTLSLSPELVEALDRTATRRGDDRSRLVETLLREHPSVAADIYGHRPYQHRAADGQRGTVKPHAGLGAQIGVEAKWENVGGKKRRVG